MSVSRKKKNPAEEENTGSSKSENEFYSLPDKEVPLAEYRDHYGRQIRRSSQRSPARRRENSNRATQREIIILLLRVVLIPAFILAAFFGLKFVVDLLDGPSKKEIREWDASEKLMESDVALESELFGTSLGEEVVVDQTFLEEQMTQWELTERHLRTAESLNQRGNVDKVISHLKQALRYSPENQAAQKLLMNVYVKKENFAAAASLCIRLLNQNSQNWEAKQSLLKVLYELDETGAAVVLATQMLELEPGDLNVMEIAAYAHAAEGDAELALKLYERILQNNRTHVLALEGSGHIYQWLKEWQAAVPYYLELIKVDPKPEHYHALARCYAKQNEESKAVIFLGQAASLYGNAAVSMWLNGQDFDGVRETIDFRALTARIVGHKRKLHNQGSRGQVSEEVKSLSIDLLRPRR